LLDCSDTFGDSKVPIYVLNVAYPLIDSELIDFCHDKKAIFLLEEGQPDFIEQSINTTLRRNDLQTRVCGKEHLPMTGDYSVRTIEKGLREFFAAWAPALVASEHDNVSAAPELADLVPSRPPGLCTGCPERPFFSAIKILEKETGPLQVSMDIGCHSFAGLEPFNIGNTQTGYGLGPASASALMATHERRAVSVMGDGGFWHNGLTTGVVNAVQNQHDGIIIIVDNGYAAATGGQWIPSSDAEDKHRQYRLSIKDAVIGVGAKWVREVDTYDIGQSVDALREAMTTQESGPKVIVAEGECQLNRQRRIAPLIRTKLEAGKRHVRQRFGIDPDTCTGDHSCIRLSGCPSLTIADNPDPLRQDPIAQVDNSCVGCGVCGEVAHAAVLCPSFYRADIIDNPNLLDRAMNRIRTRIISWLQA
jgi:indolepyruvate ferredoxin oxidoreductase alpha subunit